MSDGDEPCLPNTDLGLLICMRILCINCIYNKYTAIAKTGVASVIELTMIPTRTTINAVVVVCCM